MLSRITRVLIANRGEIACRVQRTCRRLGIETVAVYSDADAQSLHVRGANRAIHVGPSPVKDSYLNVDAILAAVESSKADAVHPGYGLLSEKEDFARRVRERGVIFIGPPEACLDAFGDKIKARSVARAAGVSPPPGSDGPIDASNNNALLEEAERIGYPLLVKAAAGGGGIGMQIVESPEKLTRAVASCSDRGKSAFADARVYMERYVTSPKHIEVQILADAHGNVATLGERECSLQRRHQKVIEETPSPAAFFSGDEGEARRRALHDAAKKIVASVGYVGAGTVEFVASPKGELFFLEVNARLQVEHCVTEMVTGVDLVEQQLRVASQERLLGEVLAIKPHGHSVEARLYAENPRKQFAPQPGMLKTLSWPTDLQNLRIETGVEQGSEVTPFYDPMIAKIVAWAPTRAEAITRLHRALSQTVVELVGPAGPAATNLDFLKSLLLSEPVARGDYDTSFAEKHAKALKAG